MSSLSDTSEPTLKKLRIRPFFMLHTAFSVEEAASALQGILTKHKDDISGIFSRNHLLIHPKKDLHYWSPYLSIHLEEEDNEEGVVIHGLYGPAPNVWTLFIFIYSILILGVVVSGIIGLANASIGESIVFLYITPLLFLILLSFYMVSYIGQRKGHKQIDILHKAVEKALEEPIELN